MMGFKEFRTLALQRRSIRNFLPDPVPRRLLEELIEIACWAPSAGNTQDWEFAVVMDKTIIAQLADAAHSWWAAMLKTDPDSAVKSELAKYSENFTWFAGVPALIIVSSKRTEAFLKSILGENSHIVAGRKLSAAMAIQNLLLAASAAGLGTCCLTGPLAADEEVRRILGLGKRRDLVCMVAIGYPGETPEPPARQPVEKVSRFLE
jgi:nitroreductase